MSRTSAEHISIQALSAEPLESAICCSSRAMRSPCASMCAGAAVCAKRTIGEHKQIKANQQRRNLGIDCSAPCLDPSSDQRLRTDQLDDNLPTAKRRGKSKIFMDAISFCAVQIGGKASCKTRDAPLVT